LLILPRKQLLIVLNEAILVVTNRVRRICKNEVVFVGSIYSGFEITDEQFSALQSLAPTFEIITRKNYCLF